MVETVPILDFPNYSITRDGNVWSQPRPGTRGGWLKTRIDKRCGRTCISLRRGGCTYTIFVHRLVLESFVGPCPPGRQCHHKDSNRLNDCLGNLEWVTPYVNTAARGAA